MEELFGATLMFDAFDVLTKTLPEKLAWKIDFNRPQREFTHQTPLNVVRKLLSDEFPQSWLRMAEEMSQHTKLNTNNTATLSESTESPSEIPPDSFKMLTIKSCKKASSRKYGREIEFYG